MNLPDAIRQTCECWRPDPVLTPDEWADAHYSLGSGESAKPGQWVTRAYQREPLQALGAYNPTRRVVLQWPAQASGKSAIGLIWAGYTAAVSPCPMLMVQPREIDAEDFSKTRLAPMAALPVLKGKIADPKSRDSGNTILLRSFPGGSWRLTASNSPAGFRGKPIARLWFDEPDGYPPSAGTEGPPVKLGRARLSSWGPRAKELMTCTPTVKNASRIEEEYLLSSQGEWNVPCPHCGEMQPLVWSGLKWDGTPGLPGFDVWYECAACAARIDEHQKTALIDRGRWIHAHPERLGDVWGGHMTAIATPYGGLEWRTLVEEWLHATARAKVGDTEPLKTFVNVRLAETWEDRGEQVDAGTVAGRVEPIDGQALPERVRVVTAGVDVQDDRLEVEVVAWAAGLESWSLGYYVIPTDPLDAETWRALDALRATTYRTTTGRALRAAVTCVDSGFRTQAVYDYAKRTRGVFAVKGNDQRSAPIWEKKARKGGKGKNLGRFNLVGVNTAKDAVAAYFRVRVAGPGYCHVPTDREPGWFEQLTAEHRVKTTVSGRDVWVWRKRASHLRNEALDCRVYALAALHAVLSTGTTLGAVQPAEAVEPVALEMSSAIATPGVDKTTPSAQPIAETVRPARAKARPQRRAPASPWGWRPT